jgi:putative hydrolase
MGSVFAQMQKLMSWTGGPVNWDLADEVATGATRPDDVPVTAEQTRQVTEACRLADVWLDAATTFPAGGAEPQAWTRTGWVSSTTPAWRALVDPVAGRVVGAMGTALEQGLGGAAGGLPEGLPPEVAGLLGGLGGPGGGLGPLRGVMDQVGGFVFGAQVGQALGALAQEVLSATEIGLPLSAPGKPALLPANVEAFSAGLEVPADDVRLYVALRELAHQRLFASVPWLQSHLFDAVDAYARGHRGRRRCDRARRRLDRPLDPESMQRAMGEGLFEIEPTPAQQAALARLETALALVEGWVDAVVDAACSATLPSAAPCARRCAAAGRPAARRADLRHARRAAAAAPPPARGGGPVGGRRRARWRERARRAVGPPRPAAVGHRPRRPGRVRGPHRRGRRGGDRLGRRPARARQGPRREPRRRRGRRPGRAVGAREFLASTGRGRRSRWSAPPATSPPGPVHPPVAGCPQGHAAGSPPRPHLRPQAVGDGVDDGPDGLVASSRRSPPVLRSRSQGEGERARRRGAP